MARIQVYSFEPSHRQNRLGAAAAAAVAAAAVTAGLKLSQQASFGLWTENKKKLLLEASVVIMCDSLWYFCLCHQPKTAVFSSPKQCKITECKVFLA
jgi:hypothetical protein